MILKEYWEKINEDDDIIPIKPVDDETFYICLDYLSQMM